MTAKGPWTWTLKRVIPSETAAGKKLLDELLARLDAERWKKRDIFSVHLAVEEALVNAIKHGNKQDRHKQVHVECRLSPDRLWIAVADEGEGFDPDEVPDCTAEENLELPCGRGILLMRNFMSRVEYNQRGNCVTLEKNRHDNADDQR